HINRKNDRSCADQVEVPRSSGRRENGLSPSRSDAEPARPSERTHVMTTVSPATTSTTGTLRRLYLVRFGFALVWAVLLFLAASRLGPVTATLLVLYPLFDVAAAVIDARSSGSRGSVRALSVNVAISAAAAIGLVVATMSGVPAVLGVWGLWAVVAGLVQLVVALRRRALG